MTEDHMKLPDDMTGQLQAIQEKLFKAQEELNNMTVTGSVANGQVKVTLTGDQKCTEIEIDPELMTPDNLDNLKVFLLNAFNEALDESRLMAAKHLSPLSPGLQAGMEE